MAKFKRLSNVLLFLATAHAGQFDLEGSQLNLFFL